jgi:sugar/nucleoside kinase (ribokinase family)
MTHPNTALPLRYRALIGTGGIGTGTFFALNDNRTLGREESRGGRFLDHSDYCKLHIITHYVRRLMGDPFTVLPIGKVGEDDHGTRLLAEMDEAGLDLRYVRAVPEHTLYCICFVYPDGTGGNLTVDDSASSKVDPSFVRNAEKDFAAFAGQGIALAVPEVPIPARAELLKLATKHRFLRAASFTSEEIQQARTSGLLASVDLLAINIDEAAALANMPAEQDPTVVVRQTVEILRQLQPDIQISITAGAHGSWVWDGAERTHAPVHDVEAVSTAGAGDAHLSGILAGLASGLALRQAHELGALTAALSVTRPHTINKEIDPQSLGAFANRLGIRLCPEVRQLIGA